ncbi:MAG: YihY/virulence factor BrkB family protein [Lachnospiraceae bacterium]|nr:YihY/virulence factor BrkB family protein [Lachnospiraceae bacterium]
MNRIVALLRVFAKELSNNNVTTLAAGAAFFLFLSLFPIIMLIGSILPYTPLSRQDFLYFLGTILPSAIAPWMQNTAEELYDKSPAVISISAVAALWSASRGTLSIMRGINSVNRVRENRNFIILRMKASFYTMIMLASIIFFLGIMVFGRVMVQITETHFPQMSHIFIFLLRFRFVYAVVILAILFMFLYKWIPNKKMKLIHQIPGAVFCSTGWTLFSDGYSYYISASPSFGVYGNLTTVIIGLLWLYVCIYLFLLGAEINFYLVPMLKYK